MAKHSSHGHHEAAPETPRAESALSSKDRSLDEYFKEHGIESPPIEIEVIYGGHESPTERERLKREIAGADIFIPEYAGYNKIAEAAHAATEGGQDLQSLESQAAEADGDEGRELVSLLYGAKRKVGFIDIASSDPLYEKLKHERRDIISGSMLGHDLDAKTPFAEALSSWGERVRDWVELEDRREGRMLENLAPEVARIVASSPELHEKPRIRVLLFLDPSHAGISKNLARRRDRVHKTEHQSSYEYPLALQEAVSIRQSQGDTTIPESVYRRSLLEALLADLTHEDFEATPEEIARFLAKLSELHRDDIVEDLYNARIKGRDHTIDYMNATLEKHGKKWPTNRAAFERFIH